MPARYTDEQRIKRLEVLNAHITIAKDKGDKKEVKRLQNLRGLTKHKWGM